MADLLEEKIAEEIIMPLCGYNPLKESNSPKNNSTVDTIPDFYDAEKGFGYRKVEDGYYYIYKKKEAYQLKAPNGYFYNFDACELGVPVVLEKGELKIKSKIYGEHQQWGLIISPKGYRHPFIGSACNKPEIDISLSSIGNYYAELKKKKLSLADTICKVLFDMDMVLSDGYFPGVCPNQSITCFESQKAGKWR